MIHKIFHLAFAGSVARAAFMVIRHFIKAVQVCGLAQGIHHGHFRFTALFFRDLGHQHLQAEHGFSILFIAHDLAVVRYLCDRVGVMYRGKLVEVAPTAELYADPVHPYTKALLSAIPIPDPIAERNRKRVDFCELDMDWNGVLTEVSPGHYVLRKEDEA